MLANSPTFAYLTIIAVDHDELLEGTKVAITYKAKCIADRLLPQMHFSLLAEFTEDVSACMSPIVFVTERFYRPCAMPL